MGALLFILTVSGGGHFTTGSGRAGAGIFVGVQAVVAVAVATTTTTAETATEEEEEGDQVCAWSDEHGKSICADGVVNEQEDDEEEETEVEEEEEEEETEREVDEEGKSQQQRRKSSSSYLPNPDGGREYFEEDGEDYEVYGYEEEEEEAEEEDDEEDAKHDTEEQSTKKSSKTSDVVVAPVKKSDMIDATQLFAIFADASQEYWNDNISHWSSGTDCDDGDWHCHMQANVKNPHGFNLTDGTLFEELFVYGQGRPDHCDECTLLSNSEFDFKSSNGFVSFPKTKYVGQATLTILAFLPDDSTDPSSSKRNTKKEAFFSHVHDMCPQKNSGMKSTLQDMFDFAFAARPLQKPTAALNNTQQQQQRSGSTREDKMSDYWFCFHGPASSSINWTHVHMVPANMSNGGYHDVPHAFSSYDNRAEYFEALPKGGVCEQGKDEDGGSAAMAQAIINILCY